MDDRRASNIIEAEISTVTMAMKRGTNSWSSTSATSSISGPTSSSSVSSGSSKSEISATEVLLRKFNDLKRRLSSNWNDPNIFLGPFLEVVKSEVVTGPVTGLALDALNKFLSYGMIRSSELSDDYNNALAVESLADAVTHARFVGVDPSSDEVVLMKILEVLRTLMMTPAGLLLTNESVCEIMQSTFRICFENRLSDLLRKTAEHVLNDIVQLLFARLPSFSEEFLPSLKRLKMRSGTSDSSSSSFSGKTKRRAPRKHPKQSKSTEVKRKSPVPPSPNPEVVGSQKPEVLQQKNEQQDPEPSEKKDISPAQDVVVDKNNENPKANHFNVDADVLARSPIGSVADLTSVMTSDAETEVEITVTSPQGTTQSKPEEEEVETKNHDKKNKEIQLSSEEFVNSQGVTFTPTADILDETTGSLIPYGLPCVRELLRFLVSLMNPHDNSNSDAMVQISLSLISTALEIGSRSLDKYESLLSLVKDELARNLVALLGSERIGIFSSALWNSFLLFSTRKCRRHLKFQLEIFLNRLMELIASESMRVTYEHKELALDLIVRLYRIPGFITQLYLNYDCDMYTCNIFEDLTKILSKNAFPVSGLYSTHFLSLDALLTVVDTIEHQCHLRIQKKDEEERSKSEIRRKIIKPGGGGGGVGGRSGYLTGLLASSIEPLEEDDEEEDDDVKIPSHEELLALKHKKKLITSSTEQFNAKPSKGIKFMAESGLISTAVEPMEVATFLRENPHLDKKQLGEYISNRKNLSILEAFVNSFDFAGLRIDEALRLFLETFRLPGEAPLITMVMEHFAEHWQKSNGDILASSDAAFTLAYAVIMLNVDQHNVNHTKTSDPMTLEQFCRNLRGTNGGADHDPEMLAEIFHNIKNSEIVMPAEQIGIVRENYLWKCVLKRGAESDFVLTPNGHFDHDLFSIIWGPTVAALSYVFDKSYDREVIEKSIQGFRKCATIAAHYRMSDVFDNLIISLCKFSTLLSVEQLCPTHVFVSQFGSNDKALCVTKLVFTLAQRYGDILREGWKNVAETLLQLFRAGLLPKSLMEAEDYVENGGRVSLYREQQADNKTESAAGFLNSFVSFISMSTESQSRVRTPEEEEYAEMASKTISDCNLDSLVTESKFLLEDSLVELVKTLIDGSPIENGNDDDYDEHPTVFYLELLTRITIQNRDRVHVIWRPVCDHLTRLIMSSASSEKIFLLERSVTALLRLSVRLARKEDLASIVIQSGLQILTALKTEGIFPVVRHISFGVYELLRNNAANIHESPDWAIIFNLIEVVGAGARPNDAAGAAPEADSGHDSRGPSPILREERSGSGGWIVLGNNEISESNEKQIAFNHFSIVHHRPIVMYDSMSFLKCCESLAFLVRDVAHITPHNFHNCVLTIRTFVEASYNGNQAQVTSSDDTVKARSSFKPPRMVTPQNRQLRRVRSAPNNFDYDADYESDSNDSNGGNDSNNSPHVALQLLDLMHTLHTRAASIHRSWGFEDTDLWPIAWCPLLQGMARLCCDRRSQVRTSALTTLQRALLFHDLQALASNEWEAAFTQVLFPMLSQLLVNSGGNERNTIEETRTRAATLLGKVFLQHLSPLTSLPTFKALWMTICDFMEKFIKSATSDLLADAVPESMKNMLLVMDTAGIFTNDDGSATPLWDLTWEKLDSFLPQLMPELFGTKQRHQTKKEEEEKKQPPPPPPLAETTTTTTASSPSQPPVSPFEQPPILPSSAFNTSTTNSSKLEISDLGTVPPPPVVNLTNPPPSVLQATSSSSSSSSQAPTPLTQVPPPPLTGFQPIHAANPSISSVPLASPKAIIPAKSTNIASYFGSASSPMMSSQIPPPVGNIITASFTPNLISQSNQVFVPGGGQQQQRQVFPQVQPKVD